MANAVKQSPFGAGPNAVSIVKSLGIKTNPKPAVQAGLDGATVLEMLGLKGMSGADRLIALQSWAETIRAARADQNAAEAALLAMPATSPKVQDAEEAQAAAIRQRQAARDRVVRLLLALLLENAKLLQ